MEDLKLPLLLFQDYNKYWSPLECMYWSQTSQVLVSKHTDSIVEEVISHYCPLCLTRFLDDEVHSYGNRCPGCFQCPMCSSLLRCVPKEEEETILVCVHCLWSSYSCGLVANLKSDLELKIRKMERDVHSRDIHQSLTKFYQTDSQESYSLSKIANFSLGRSISNSEKKAWSVDALENKLQSKTIANRSSIQLNKTLENHLAVLRLTSIVENAKFFNSNKESEITTVHQRRQLENLQPNFVKDIIPNRYLLRTKRTIRCRKDLDEGKMNILVQPKQFPLEGDSSLKIQKGKWWVKDSSAIHEIPYISIIKLPEKELLLGGGVSYLHLLVSNPKESIQTITFFNCNSEINFSSMNETTSIVTDPRFTKRKSFGEGNVKTVNQSDVVNLVLCTPTLPPNTYGSAPASSMDCMPAISVRINAYEDELLREGSDEESDTQKSTKDRINEQISYRESPPDLFQNISTQHDEINSSYCWELDTHHNSATIKIPIKIKTFAADLNKSENGNGLSTLNEKIFEIRLCTTLGYTIGESKFNEILLPLIIVFR